jgi:thiamine pyrophosphokinase
MATDAGQENKRKISSLMNDSICDIISSINQLLALSLNLSALNADFDSLSDEELQSFPKVL